MIEGPIFLSNGHPAAGCRVEFYVAGTDPRVPVDVFMDAELKTLHSWPVILDSEGCPPAPIYLPPAATTVRIVG